MSTRVPQCTQPAHEACATHQRVARGSVWGAGPHQTVSHLLCGDQRLPQAPHPHFHPRTGVSGGHRLTRGLCTMLAPGESVLGSCPIFLSSRDFLFSPMKEPACSARVSLLSLCAVIKSLMGTCGHSSCLFILAQGSGSFSNPISDPEQALRKEQGAAGPQGVPRNFGVRPQPRCSGQLPRLGHRALV